jgi:hypothetical protein
MTLVVPPTQSFIVFVPDETALERAYRESVQSVADTLGDRARSRRESQLKVVVNGEAVSAAVSPVIVPRGNDCALLTVRLKDDFRLFVLVVREGPSAWTVHRGATVAMMDEDGFMDLPFSAQYALLGY